MQLKCKINGKEHKIVQGNTFRDEYNETLDSGSVIISQIEQLKDLKPYNDVYIYDNEFNGYYYLQKEFIPKTSIKMTDILGDKSIRAYIEGKEILNYINKENSVTTIKFRLLDKEKTTDKFYYTVLKDYKMSYDSVEDELIFIPENESSVFPTFHFRWNRRLNDFFVPIGEEIFLLRQSSYNSFEKYVPLSFETFVIMWEETSNTNNKFYKHLLVDRFSEEIINLDKKTYNYRIELFSETKGLEVVQLPNISITQPLDYDKKRSVWDYLNQFVDMYSPKVKMADDKTNNSWKYVNKYKISLSLKKFFSDVYAPDFSLNNPNLRDVLSRLMMVKDMIPYVKDDVIYAMDITKRGQEFGYEPEYFNFVSTSLSSDNFCDNLKRTYSDALTQDSSCRRVEYLGFRNSSTALMTLENMRIETNFPIYKINKMYMCYYKKVNVFYEKDTEGRKQEKIFLCKQDITPLIKLDYETNFLNPNWMDFYNDLKNGQIKNLESLSKYKFAVVNYSQGSKNITGWGNKVTYLPFDDDTLLTWFKRDKTYLENIFNFIDEKKPFGEVLVNYLDDSSLENIDFLIPQNLETGGELLDNIPYYVTSTEVKKGEITSTENVEINALKLKSFFFIVDYDAFYNGTVIHSKDDALDNIVINDNASSSLTVLENDGLHQKEKINRYGNKGFTILARYKGDEIDKIKNLGDVYNDGENEDIIIYHREISIFDNVINCKYYGMKDYVLKNFFTSVFAKHRTYNLMSYGESTRRAENNKIYLSLSKDNQYFESTDSYLNFSNLSSGDNILEKIFSFMKVSTIDENTFSILNDDRINSGYISYGDIEYSCDANIFVSGYSMCLNLSMFDNVSPGVYISTRTPVFDKSIVNIFNGEEIKDDYTGSLQSYYLIVDDETTGFTKNMGFYFSHIDDNNDIIKRITSLEEAKEQYKRLEKFPKIDKDYFNKTNIIGADFEINKDNKELIDMTFQFEPVTQDKNIIFNQWLMKLSNLIGSHNKFNSDIETEETIDFIDNSFEEHSFLVNDSGYMQNLMILKFYKDEISEISNKGINKINLKYPAFIFKKSSYINERDVYPSMVGFEQIITELDIVKDADENINLEITDGKFLQTSYIVMSQNDFNNQKITIGTKKNYTHGEEKWKFIPYSKFLEDFSDSIYANKPNFNDTNLFDYYICVIDKIVKADIENDRIITYKYFLTDSEKEKNTFGAIHFTSEKQDSDSFYWENFIYSGITGNMITLHPRNMYMKISKTPMKKTIVYDEYPLSFLDNNEFTDFDGIELQDKELLPSEIFRVNENKIETSLAILQLKNYNIEEIGSIQQWYYDNGSLKFVFGVNITDKDKQRFKEDANYRMPIYISMLSRRDTRVYDEYHNIVGNVTNCVDEPDSWGIQKYTPKDNS